MTKCYKYQFNTYISFSSYIHQHSFKLRCVPMSNSIQRLAKSEVGLEPFAHIERTTDFFNNRIITGEITREHDHFAIKSSGLVEMAPYRLRESCHPAYSCFSNLTTPDKAMQEWSESLAPLMNKDDWKRALQIAQWVNLLIKYTPQATDTTTTAAEVLQLKQGVCQDYAHLMIAMCRMNDIAARYVCGFMQGEGVTHAWVEVYYDGCWLAIDPTHNRTIEYGYIKLAQGRDADDCPVNRGVFTGHAIQTTRVEVIVEEI